MKIESHLILKSDTTIEGQIETHGVDKEQKRTKQGCLSLRQIDLRWGTKRTMWIKVKAD